MNIRENVPAPAADSAAFGGTDSADFLRALRSGNDLSNELLARAAREGNGEAKNELFRRNQKLVTKYAAQYVGIFGSTLDMEELISAGNLGLLRAVDLFDAARGYSFSTYAVWWIRQAIYRDIQEHGYIIRIPNHMHERIGRVIRAESELLIQGKKSGNRVAAIVEALKDRNQPLTEDQVIECLQLRENIMRNKSQDMPVGEDEEAVLSDFIPADPSNSPEYLLERHAVKSDLAAVLNTLNPREREVLILRYGLDGKGIRTLEEIGKTYGVTRERIRQLEKQALRKLRIIAEKVDLGIYLEDIA